MFGPVLKELTKNHREKQERENYNKIEEIKNKSLKRKQGFKIYWDSLFLYSLFLMFFT